MQNERDNLNGIFQRIFTGTATDEEKGRIARWLSTLNLHQQDLSFQEVEARRLEFQKKFQKNQFERSQRRQILRFPGWAVTAAAAMFLLATCIFFYVYRLNSTKEIVYLNIETHPGERKLIALQDGSKITLNNSSRLRYPTNFSGNTREVFLEGEAFFEVVHQKEKPFIVRAGKLHIQVLGTSFDVSNYTSDFRANVSVSTGKVGVIAGDHKKSHLLTPGQQISYNKVTGKINTSDLNPLGIAGWLRGELIFKNEQLIHICQGLERWYDVRITIKKHALIEQKVSIDQKNESLENVLRMLSIAVGFQYEIKGKEVNIW